MRTSSPIYVPVVKGKKNDLIALGKLPNETRAKILPLIEMMPLLNERTVEDHVEKFAVGVASNCLSGRIAIDVGFSASDLTSTGAKASIYAFRRLMSGGRRYVPCYGFQRDDDIWHDLGALVRALNTGFAFRIDRDDLDDVAEDTWAAILVRTAELGLRTSEIDLFIDARSLTAETVGNVRDVIADFLAMAPANSSFRSIVILGSSALKTVTTVPKDNVGRILRQELLLWLSLNEEFEGRFALVFGDYGVIHPDFTDAAPAPNANGKIRYTSGHEIIYHRGHGLTRPSSDYAQYRALAAGVVSSLEYRGRSFSYGDDWIFQCANHMCGTGNLGTWVQVDMNHHLQITFNQMAAVQERVIETVQRAALARVIATV